MIFGDFQSASPRKCLGPEMWNSTELKYPIVLQTGRVSASWLISTLLCRTSEHGQNLKFRLMGYSRLFTIFKMQFLSHGLAISWETPLNWSTVGYYKLVNSQLQYVFLHLLPTPLNMVKNHDFQLSYSTGPRLWNLVSNWLKSFEGVVRTCSKLVHKGYFTRGVHFWHF